MDITGLTNAECYSNFRLTFLHPHCYCDWCVQLWPTELWLTVNVSLGFHEHALLCWITVPEGMFSVVCLSFGISLNSLGRVGETLVYWCALSLLWCHESWVLLRSSPALLGAFGTGSHSPQGNLELGECLERKIALSQWYCAPRTSETNTALS